MISGSAIAAQAAQSIPSISSLARAQPQRAEGFGLASRVMKSVRDLIERRALQRQQCEALLADHGWMPLVPITSGLPLATIAQRGSMVCGVALCADDTWSTARQDELLRLAQQDGWDGLVLVGRPQEGAQQLPGVIFVQPPQPVPVHAHRERA